MPKGTSPAEATSSSEKIKLAHIESCLTVGISQAAVRHSEENSINKKGLKFRGNVLKEFWVNLKTCLGLVYLTNTAPLSVRKIEAGY